MNLIRRSNLSYGLESREQKELLKNFCSLFILTAEKILEYGIYICDEKMNGGAMYILKGKKVEKIESITFSELGMKENDLEEVLRGSIEMICGEEESMLIVGQQVKNERNCRSDLTAVDSNGNIV